MRKGVGKTLGGYTCVVVFGGKRNNTEGEQTTKKWVVDETREKIDEVEDGRERQPSSQRVLLTL